MLNKRLAGPAVFGLADGMMSLLGVILYLTGHPKLIFPVALSGAISSSFSMAGGQWLSSPEDGKRAAVTMGTATGVGAMLPAIPFAFLPAGWALAAAAAVCTVIGVAVAFLRPESTIRSLTITFAVLIAVFAVGMLCAVFLPGMAG